MIAEIDRAREAGDTLGGAFEVIARGVPVGLGSYIQWDRKLDGRLAQALMSIPAIKAVGIGLGPEAAYRPGSRVHDEIVPRRCERIPPLARPTNNAGGLEGGVTNGEDLRVSAWMKPISTLMKPLRSVDLATMTESAGGDRAQRRLRGACRGGRRRGDGGARAGGRAAREVRRRLDRGARSRPAKLVIVHVRPLPGSRAALTPRCSGRFCGTARRPSTVPPPP